MNFNKNYIYEITLIASWILFICIILSLGTYSPDDAAWSVSDNNGGLDNKIGVFGAYTADILFNLFGYSAYLLAFVALLALHIGLYRVRSNAQQTNPEALKWPWQVTGVIIFILTSSSLEFLRFNIAGESLPAGSGGIVGRTIANPMINFFGTDGGSLIIAGLWMISYSLTAGLSWLALAELVGAKAEKITINIYDFFVQRRSVKIGEKAREKRKTEVKGVYWLLKNRERKAAAKTEIKLTNTKQKTAPPKPLAARTQLSLTETNNANDDGKQQALPPSALLDPYPEEESEIVSPETLEYNSRLIEKNLLDFGVSAHVEDALPGPVITRYDVRPAVGVKGSQIVNLIKDMARTMSVGNIRILETIDGKDCMGLEIPNPNRRTVYFSELITSAEFNDVNSELPITLGKDAAGVPVIIDLTAMPHMLVAGATGSGKSVCINAMLLSLMFAATADKLRLILIDPKMLELSAYAGIPHLLAPVITDMSEAPAALNWCVNEMERRYRLISQSGARGITTYNKIVSKENKLGEDGTPLKPLPYLVIIIDELADLMMVAGKKIEITISRLAQKARAAGIHLILATQRPSVDVITGLIKANVPSRVAFQVASRVDSRTIIDQMGADTLLGKGDMLFVPIGGGTPKRVHGAFVSDDEVKRVVTHMRRNSHAQEMVDFTQQLATAGTENNNTAEGNNGEEDQLYDQAVEAVLSSNRPSISLVQRKLRIGYNRAARLIESMEAAGLISEMNETGTRKILTQRRE